MSERLAWAIENNVHWHDALCDIHAVPGQRERAFWINRQQMPPYMSNLITLRDGAEATAQLDAVRSLRHLGTGYGVKDSFQCLSLEELGLRVLFRATWICRSSTRPAPAETDLRWRVACAERDLQTWEQTWRGTPDNAAARPDPRIFPSSLLGRSDIRFLLGERSGRVVATAALNRSAHAVGLSNVSSSVAEPAGLFAGCVRAAAKLFPGLPLVGYQREEHLAAALATGFEAVHGLTVWVSAASTAP